MGLLIASIRTVAMAKTRWRFRLEVKTTATIYLASRLVLGILLLVGLIVTLWFVAMKETFGIKESLSKRGLKNAGPKC